MRPCTAPQVFSFADGGADNIGRSLCGDSGWSRQSSPQMEQHIYHDRRRSYCSSLRSRRAQVAAGERVHGERAPMTSTSQALGISCPDLTLDGADVNPRFSCSEVQHWCGGVSMSLATIHSLRTTNSFRHGDQFICRNTAGVGIIDQSAGGASHPHEYRHHAALNPGKYLG